MPRQAAGRRAMVTAAAAPDVWALDFGMPHCLLLLLLLLVMLLLVTLLLS